MQTLVYDFTFLGHNEKVYTFCSMSCVASVVEDSHNLNSGSKSFSQAQLATMSTFICHKHVEY